MAVAVVIAYSLDMMVESRLIHFFALLLITVIWIIAQYLSFAVQLTGHVWPSQHLRALMNIGPVTVVCLALGVSAWLLYYLLVVEKEDASFVEQPLSKFVEIVTESARACSALA